MSRRLSGCRTRSRIAMLGLAMRAGRFNQSQHLEVVEGRHGCKHICNDSFSKCRAFAKVSPFT